MEPGSVNAIALDDAPEDRHDRLMVAMTSSVNASGTKIIARDTTLLPNIHGMAPLMAMLFSPVVQLR